MADFNVSFESMIRNEGGYKLHQVEGDRGGQTYAGIARKFNPNWPGWEYIDRKDLNNGALSGLVREFYRTNYWNRMKGDEIKEQEVADTIFDFAVNAGITTACNLAQLVVDAVSDGIIGQKTLSLLNKADKQIFLLKYAVAKVTRYAGICTRDSTQNKFLLGWINRTIKGLV